MWLASFSVGHVNNGKCNEGSPNVKYASLHDYIYVNFVQQLEL